MRWDYSRTIVGDHMRKTRKKRVRGNPIAEDLRQPKYKIRVVRSSKVYDRKKQPKVRALVDYGQA